MHGYSATVDVYKVYVEMKKKEWKKYSDTLLKLAKEFRDLDGQTNPEYLLSSLDYFKGQREDVTNFCNNLFIDKSIVQHVFEKEHFLRNTYFAPGDYQPDRLKEAERRNLDTMYNEIASTRDKISGYNESEIILEIKLIGSADGLPMYGSIKNEYINLRQQLLNSTNQIMFFDVIDGRKDSENDPANYYLSLCRAISIGQYLVQKLKSYQIRIKVVGMGKISKKINEEYRKCSVSFTFYRKENQQIVAKGN